MFKSNTNYKPLAHEQEARSMVAFIDKLDEIKKVLEELNTAREKASQAEHSAYVANRNLDMREAVIVQKEQAVDKLIEANVAALQKVQAEIDVAKAVQEDCAKKQIAVAKWEENAAAHEKDYAERVAVLNQMANDVVAREDAVAIREKSLQDKLDSLKSV